MKNYNLLTILILAIFFFTFSSSNIKAQKTIKLSDFVSLSSNGYGNRIVITDHVPNGGGPDHLGTTNGIAPCDCDQQLAYNNTSITTPSELFIHWSEFNAQLNSKYRILISGKPTVPSYPDFNSDIFFHFEADKIGHMGSCGELGPNKITNQSLVFDYWQYPSYTVSFYQLGVLIEFPLGTITSVKVFQLSNCTPYNINTRQQQLESKTSLTISPNPFQNAILLDYAVEQTSQASLNIFNATGQKLISVFENKVIEPGQYRIKRQLDLPKGIYFAILQTDTQRKVVKIVKQ